MATIELTDNERQHLLRLLEREWQDWDQKRHTVDAWCNDSDQRITRRLFQISDLMAKVRR